MSSGSDRATIDAVNLSRGIDSDAAFLAWLDSGALAGASELVLWNGRLTDVSVRALVDCPDAATLQTLDLSWNRIGPDGARTLASALPELESLRLYHNDVGAPGAETIANAPWRLASLNLCGNGIGVRGATALARGRATAELRSVHLGWVELGDAGVEQLAKRCWDRLTELNVRDNGITSTGVRPLVSDAFPKLRRLGLDDNPVDASALPKLRARRFDRINLAGCEIEGLVQ